MIYLHGSDKRQQAIADTLSQLTCKGSWAPRARLERATYCLGGSCSIR